MSEKKINPVCKAYNILFRVMYRTDGREPSEEELTFAIGAALGYLGQALDTAPIEAPIFSVIKEMRELHALDKEAREKMRVYANPEK